MNKRITNPQDLTHGMKVRVRIEGSLIEDAKISKHYGEIHLCQNVLNGHHDHIPEKFGYKYAWDITPYGRNYAFDESDKIEFIEVIEEDREEDNNFLPNGTTVRIKPVEELRESSWWADSLAKYANQVTTIVEPFIFHNKKEEGYILKVNPKWKFKKDMVEPISLTSEPTGLITLTKQEIADKLGIEVENLRIVV